MKLRFLPAAVLFALLFSSERLQAQAGVGFPFLKIDTGARQSGMGGAFTGVSDDIYALYWNPGGVGHLRRWQWSASYNRWFADIYQGQLSYVKQFRILGSSKTAIGASVSYLGMPSWDATGGLEPSVTASHTLALISVGQRLDWLSPAVSIGVNLKGFSSTFDQLSSRGMAWDAGILIRPSRFTVEGLGPFDYGIFSFGASLQHLGSTVTVENAESALPRTIRVGASLRLGRYGGLSMLLASDAVAVRRRNLTVGLGSELWWQDILGVRFGYRFNKEDLGDFTFGIGLRWNDAFNQLLGLPTRYGDAVEIDMANVGYGSVLQETYRGTVLHYPLAPEPFRLKEPQVVTSQVVGISSQVELKWEKAFDPDPFDEVKYIVLITKDRKFLEKAIRMIEYDMDGFMASRTRDSLLVCQLVEGTSYRTQVQERGVYYWAVTAYDLSHHARLAQRGEQKVGRFVIETADLVVKEVRFDYSPWITTTPEQGQLSFVITNQGNGPAPRFTFKAFDTYAVDSREEEKPLAQARIYNLPAGEDTTVSVDWFTEYTGTHTILTVIDPDSGVLELKRENNVRRDKINSIPKGTFQVPDTVEVVITDYDVAEIPLVPEIYFDAFSSEVKPEFSAELEPIPGVLLTLAERILNNPSVTLRVMGYIDDLSGEENPALALQRAQAVKQRLMELGVPSRRIEVVKDHPNIIIKDYKRDDPQDNLYHMQQNRKVTFAVDQNFEEKIFGPYSVQVDTTILNPIVLALNITSPAGVKEWSIQGSRKVLILQQGLVNNNELQGDISWDGTDRDRNTVPINKSYRLDFQLQDQENRTFKARPRDMYLREQQTVTRREMFGAAKFAKVEPVYQFYWDRLMDIAKEMVANPNMKLRFEGHACATGPEKLNQRLSLNRAKYFSEAFLQRIRTSYPSRYQDIRRRVAKPVGYGEDRPLTLKMQGQKEVLLGDNQSPVGRYLNRRIMVFLYKEQ